MRLVLVLSVLLALGACAGRPTTSAPGTTTPQPAAVARWRAQLDAAGAAVARADQPEALTAMRDAAATAAGFGAIHPDHAATLAALAALLSEAGPEAEAEAEACWGRALAACGGRDDDLAAGCRYGLAGVLAARGDLIAAEAQLTAALATLEARAADPPKLGPVVAALVAVRLRAGDAAGAEPLALHVLALAERATGAESSAVADALVPLAAAQSASGRSAQAKASLARAVAIRRGERAGPPEALGMVLVQYAEVCAAAGDPAAEAAWRSALGHWEASSGSDHPDTAAVRIGLASVLAAGGRAGEAEALFARALVVAEGAFGAGHPALLPAIDGLAWARAAQGRWTEALTLGERGLRIRAAAGGTDRAEYVQALDALVGLCAAGGRHAEALAFTERALEISERSLGPDHPQVALARRNGDQLRALLAAPSPPP